MSFLKFLKKDKKKMDLDDSLDIPPMPPPIGHDFPSQDIPHKMEPKIPKQMPGQGMPSFSFKQENPMPAPDKDLDVMPEEPSFEMGDIPPLEEEKEFVPKPPVEEPMKGMPKPEEVKPVKRFTPEPKDKFYKKFEEDSVKEERKMLRRPMIDEPLFIKLDNFKETLGNMNVLRADLKKSDEILVNLINSKAEKERQIDRWHKQLEDLQKKFIFVEKIVFEGD